ncbi:hypothetical protein NPIL_493371 [Nephila pilipes]|uniref:Uncharacterized protein n=1 Tax=Nephila pilipes TaxID=299642 RepID=A0A8X6R1W4_NEPPI|nr:hypothetical protein NPIL_493371 [Nephila pilipes]
MFIIFDSYLPSFYYIIGYSLVTEVIKFCLLSTYFKGKQLKREIPVHTKEHTIGIQLTPPEVTPKFTLQRQYQIKPNKTTPKAHSEIICNSLNIEVQFSPLEKATARF